MYERVITITEFEKLYMTIGRLGRIASGAEFEIKDLFDDIEWESMKPCSALGKKFKAVINVAGDKLGIANTSETSKYKKI